jgi:hypothetical protein
MDRGNDLSLYFNATDAEVEDLQKFHPKIKVHSNPLPQTKSFKYRLNDNQGLWDLLGIMGPSGRFQLGLNKNDAGHDFAEEPTPEAPVAPEVSEAPDAVDFKADEKMQRLDMYNAQSRMRSLKLIEATMKKKAEKDCFVCGDEADGGKDFKDRPICKECREG